MDKSYLLWKEISESEAKKVYLRLQHFSTNFFVFERNFQELKKLLASAQSPETLNLIWIPEKSKDMMFVMRELTRLLLNYLASAKALVDQTRVLMNREYSNTDFLKTYKEEVKRRFVDNELTEFIEDLRNYSLHYQIPFAGAHLQMDIEPETDSHIITQVFSLDRAKLTMKSYEWSKGKKFLDHTIKDIVIIDLIEQYYKEILAFHTWLDEEFQSIHYNQLSWLKTRQQELDKLVAEENRLLQQKLQSGTSPT